MAELTSPIFLLLRVGFREEEEDAGLLGGQKQRRKAREEEKKGGCADIELACCYHEDSFPVLSKNHLKKCICVPLISKKGASD